MDKYAFYQMYRALYEQLKGPGLDNFLQREFLDAGERETIRLVANLPHPAEATRDQIMELCAECQAGRLEDISGVADAAGMVEALLEFSDDQEWGQIPASLARPSDGYTLDDIAMMLYDTNLMLFDYNAILWSANGILSRIRQHTDYTLKGLCPDCNGDLAVVIERATNGDLELRLKCYECSNGYPSNKRWVITRVTEQP